MTSEGEGEQRWAEEKREQESSTNEPSGLAVGKEAEEMLREVRHIAEPGEVGIGELVSSVDSEGEQTGLQDTTILMGRATTDQQESPRETIDDYMRIIAGRLSAIDKHMAEHNMLFRRFLKSYKKAHNQVPPPDTPMQGSNRNAPADQDTASNVRAKLRTSE